jgi:hypothetical protein
MEQRGSSLPLKVAHGKHHLYTMEPLIHQCGFHLWQGVAFLLFLLGVLSQGQAGAEGFLAALACIVLLTAVAPVMVNEM